MGTPKFYAGCYRGLSYRIKYDQACNVTYAFETAPKTWRWWLTVEGEYVGDFGTLRAAKDELDKLSRLKSK